MLELKNLTKIYRTSGGAETCALEEVSVRFGRTGLVFILGKSGSGKSTLLNLAGGLDAPTSGEVVVLGKSSKDFTGSDFDSYRNTYVGFIFQEYNLLDEFTVEGNVALALELQGRKKDKGKIEEILREVELENFAQRKIGTLSGGQKQRVAIARALVKEPQIIMADEPTGALDEATGKQVLSTLKKLSQTRLVLIVSHDREFAETYGDRIIELKDGKIVSDVSKVPEEADEARGTVRRIGAGTLSVTGGNTDGETMRAIEAFLKENAGEVFISRDEREIIAFRSENGGRHGRFEQTREIPSPQKEERAAFIRSRLPAGRALRLGVSGLKLKPVRLFFTVLLSFIAFVMFGLFSTMMLYDGDRVLRNSFLNSEYEYLAISKFYEVRETNYDNGAVSKYNEPTWFTPAEVESFGEGAFGAYTSGAATPTNLTVESTSFDYYYPTVYKIACLPEGHPLREALGENYPTAPNEIAVSSYFLECARHSTFKKYSGGYFRVEKNIDTAEDLIGEYLGVDNLTVKVSGVFDSGKIPAKYDSLKVRGEGDWLTKLLYQAYLAEGMHTLVLVSETFMEEYGTHLAGTYYDNVDYFDALEDSYDLYATEDLDSRATEVYEIQVYDADVKNMMPVIPFGESVKTLADDQLIVSVENFRWIAQRKFEALYPYPQTTEIRQILNAFLAACNTLGHKSSYERPSTEEEKALALVTFSAFVQEYGPFRVEARRDGERLGAFEIVGAYLNTHPKTETGVYCSQNVYDMADLRTKIEDDNKETKYRTERDAEFNYVLLPFGHGEAEFEALLSRLNTKNPQTDVVYAFNNLLYQNVLIANNIVGTLSQIFLLAGVAMAIFAALLLFNFISVSVVNKKKEIGILRAVGARGLDVFKIFFAEAGIIAGFCALLSTIGASIVTVVLNGALKVKVGLDVALFHFGVLPILLMVGIAALVAVVATALPVWSAARKKPVESIRTL